MATHGRGVGVGAVHAGLGRVLRGVALVVAAAVVHPIPARAAPLAIWAEHDAGVSIPALPGYRGYTVFLRSSDPASPAAAWEGSFDGPMNQVLLGGVAATPSMSVARYLGADLPADSHFLLFDETDMVIVHAPEESGTFLRGTFGITVPARRQDLPLAYLVIPDGGQVVMTGGTTDPQGRQALPIYLVVPEPTAAWMLAAGGLALLGGFRRGRGRR